MYFASFFHGFHSVVIIRGVVDGRGYGLLLLIPNLCLLFSVHRVCMVEVFEMALGFSLAFASFLECQIRVVSFNTICGWFAVSRSWYSLARSSSNVYRN